MSKRVLLIISGSIAAYKSLELIRLLRQDGLAVNAILTQGGAEFITPLSVSSLTGSETYTELFSLKDEVEMGHIRLAREADAILVAPASADLLSKMAQGMANDLATATLLAADVPVFVAPAMNHRMWEKDATQRNIKQLEQDGISVIAPESGDLACGETGSGRMADPEAIRQILLKQLELTPRPAPLAGKKAIVNAGPTQEPIDPVRYLSNHSSGKQGYAIARALWLAGADVTLISGPTHLPPVSEASQINVQTASEMYDATLGALHADIAICTAAVADWTVAQPAEQKLKKRDSGEPPTLQLTETRDILAALSQHPTDRPDLVIGFAAETEKMASHAKAKRERKGCDWIVANDTSGGKIFGADDTEVTLVTAEGSEPWPPMSKQDVAYKLTDAIIAFFNANQQRGAA